MHEDSATGPGLTNPVYPDLVARLASATTPVPDNVVRFVLAVCSSYAYGDARTVATIMDRLGLTRNRCRMISEYVDALFLTSTAYVIQSRDGRVAIVCYRGTPPTSIVTWLTDFQVEPTRIPVPALAARGKAEVHGGFYRNVRSTRFKIAEVLREAIAQRSVLDDTATDCPLEALYITGHSLGGASAALFAALLVADLSRYGDIFAKLKAVYTYGSPMIGNPSFADACNRHPFLGEQVIRYVYADDVVPQVPPKASGDFKHFGKEYRYLPPESRYLRPRRGRVKGEWKCGPPRTQLHHLLSLATAPLAFVAKGLRSTRHIRFHASLSDHLPQHYLGRLTPEHLRSEFGE